MRDKALVRLVVDAGDIEKLHRPSVRIATAAQIIDVDIATAYRLAYAGVIEGHRIGKRGIRIFLDSLRAYQEENPIAKKPLKTQASDAPKQKWQRPEHWQSMAFLQQSGVL